MPVISAVELLLVAVALMAGMEVAKVVARLTISAVVGEAAMVTETRGGIRCYA